MMSLGRMGWRWMWVVLFSSVAMAQDYGDTPYVQTPQVVVDRMLQIAKVSAKDYLIDLGSGDGRMIITAAKRYGAQGFGVDLDKRLVELANVNAKKAGVAKRAVFYERDLHETDLRRADVITIYLLPEVNLTVRPRILALKPGTRLVSHDYGFGEWPPDLELTMDAPGKPVGRDQKSKILYWVVPARIAGKWVWQGPGGAYELQLDQVFQKITGTLGSGGQRAALEKAVLTGDQISFEAVLGKDRQAFSGRIVNNAVEGKMRVAGVTRAWNATRTELREGRFSDLKPGIMAR
jgi:SAM-dependent methyltransferase